MAQARAHLSKLSSICFGLRRSIRWRLVSLLTLVWLAALLLIWLSVNYFIYRTEAAAWRGRQGEAARNAAGAVSAFIQRAHTSLFLMGLLGQNELTTRPGVIGEIVQQNPAFQEVIYLNDNGQVVASAAQGRPLLAHLFTIPQSQWFLAAKQGRAYYGALQFSATDEPYLIMALPTTEGVIAGRLRMDVLWKVVEDIHFGAAGRAYVVTSEGQIIAHTNPEVVLTHRFITEQPELLAAVASPNRAWSGAYIDLNGVPVVGVTAAVPDTDWVVITELPQREAFAASQLAFLLSGAGVIFFGALLIWTSTRFLDSVILQPLQALRDGSLRIGQGDLSYRINLNRQDEVGQLAAAFNEMAKNLDQRNTQLDAKTMALQAEIAERARVEEKIKASLHEKEVLLREIHHRVKNNLQIISSLLNLQSGYIGDRQALECFKDSQNRVRSMALIHEKLYRSENLAQIDFAEYIRELAGFLFRSHGAEARGIKLNIQADEVFLTIDTAVPCALILNELVSNILKHAFPNGRKGTTWISVEVDPNHRLTLSVADNGAGFPADLDFRATESLGLQLVNTLVDQLEGAIELIRQPGTTFKIRFTARQMALHSGL